jgi:hypothetical protein
VTRGAAGATPLRPQPAYESPLRRLMVISPAVPDVVGILGGWIFDQAMAGWVVVVSAPDLADGRPLRILGARGSHLGGQLAEPLRAWRPRAISIQADMYREDPGIREYVAQAQSTGPVEVMFWGGDPPAAEEGDARLVRHRLSLAARAFKAQALIAAQACQPSREAAAHGGSDDTEAYFRDVAG